MVRVRRAAADLVEVGGWGRHGDRPRRSRHVAEVGTHENLGPWSEDRRGIRVLEGIGPRHRHEVLRPHLATDRRYHPTREPHGEELLVEDAPGIHDLLI